MHKAAFPNETLTDLSNFLTEPLASSLFQFHPNDLATSSFQPPTLWTDWWDWAGDTSSDAGKDPWLSLMHYYDLHRPFQTRTDGHEWDSLQDTIPASLRLLIDDARRLALSREAGHTVFPQAETQPRYVRPCDSESTASPLPGMSPKKSHEVNQMAHLVDSVLQSDPALSNVRHIVDVGAGQAYLSRALRDRLGQHVLALDFSDVQSQGAAKRDAAKPKRKMQQRNTSNIESAVNRSESLASGQSPDHFNASESADINRGSLTYMTTKIDESTLQSATDAWLETDTDMSSIASTNSTVDIANRRPTPVVFVALHACGSLTPDILRAFAAAHKRVSDTEPPLKWSPQAAIIVGCCYNMMRPEDFPLSRELRSSSEPKFKLEMSHRQLAAQVPSQWTRSEESLRDARLALRKIVWRALIQDSLAAEKSSSGKGLDETSPEEGIGLPKRLGRLNDAAYADWETFVHRVQAKLGLPDGKLERADRAVERRIEVFHVLRCLLGPVIESLILRDRALWVRDMLQASRTSLGVELVNLFDQASGSGRNMTIVIRPRNHNDAASSAGE
ncbi:methyltransferase domain-containing protein [Lenzites betulinus]|nr:methyltransferase domain-containing protein [Lenzites betulinus]